MGVAYGSDVGKVTTRLEQSAEEHPHGLQDPPMGVLFDDFGDSALIVELNVGAHSNAGRGLRVVRSLRYRIDELFRENGVVISFPQRDVYVNGELFVRRSGT